ncbi:MAG: hypothetical protein J5716_08960 [Alphaproteobacteria bacterium]|nr:hypothetical protein [Alphaproteobacteria bacterium]
MSLKRTYGFTGLFSAKTTGLFFCLIDLIVALLKGILWLFGLYQKEEKFDYEAYVEQQDAIDWVYQSVEEEFERNCINARKNLAEKRRKKGERKNRKRN